MEMEIEQRLLNATYYEFGKAGLDGWNAKISENKNNDSGDCKIVCTRGISYEDKLVIYCDIDRLVEQDGKFFHFTAPRNSLEVETVKDIVEKIKINPSLV